MGFSNEILSTDAVTTGVLQCFIAARAAAISIQYINRPPIKLPNILVSLGNTNSVMVTTDSLAVLENWSMLFFAQRYGVEGLYSYLFKGLKKSLIGIGAYAWGFRHLQKKAFVLHTAGNRVGLMTQHTGIHIVKNDIVVRQRKMRKCRKGHPAFKHTTHHTGDIIFFTYLM